MTVPPDVRAEPAAPSGDGGLTRVRLDLSYDGTEFSGWAVQPGFRTVQGELETALQTLARLPVRTTVAGRTDAGVHATGQVVHVDVDGPPDQRRLNGLLPPDIRIRRVSVVPPEFDARFSAVARHYEYRVTDEIPEPLRRYDTVAWPRPLDAALMHGAAQELLGENDFAAYCRRRDGATTVRTLRRLDVARLDDGIILARVSADAFCHSMVRALMGALLAVGDGREQTSWPATVLAGRVRHSAVTVAKAKGLTLVRVDYPEGAAALAARQRESRVLRVVGAGERAE